MPIQEPEFALVYRTGGTDNFKWHTRQYASETDAWKAKREANQNGYRAYVHQVSQFGVVPVPDTYKPSKTDNQSHYDSSVDFKTYMDGQRKLHRINTNQIESAAKRDEKRSERSKRLIRNSYSPSPDAQISFGPLKTQTYTADDSDGYISKYATKSVAVKNNGRQIGFIQASNKAPLVDIRKDETLAESAKRVSIKAPKANEPVWRFATFDHRNNQSGLTLTQAKRSARKAFSV